jgi:hypothetical protein
MPALSAHAFPQETAGDEQALQAAWRDAVREYALTRPVHSTTLPQRWRRWAWLLAAALHLVMLIGLRATLHMPQRVPEETVITVELIDTAADPPVEPASPLRDPPPAVRAPPGAIVARPPRRPNPIAAPEAPVVPEMPAEFHAYNPDGSVDVPADLAEQLDRLQPRADFLPLKVAPSPILNPRRPLKLRPNHFAQYWNGTDGMPLHESMWRYVTATKEFVAPWGGHYGCTWILILVACADIPDKPWNPPQVWKPATEFDEQ